MRYALAVLVLLAACSQAEQPPSEVVGVITAIEGDIGAISVVEDDGDEYSVAIADDVEYGFDLQHLREHEATGDPVHVRLEERGGHLVALSIDDA